MASQLGRSLAAAPLLKAAVRDAAWFVEHHGVLLLTSGTSGSDLGLAAAAAWRLPVRYYHLNVTGGVARGHLDWFSVPHPVAGPLTVHPLLARDSPRVPTADRALSQLGEHLFCLWVRPHGRISRLIDRLLAEAQQHRTIWIPTAPELIAAKTRRRWLSRGARAWQISASAVKSRSATPRARAANTTTLAMLGPRDRWLVHCTRETNRRRVGESRSGFARRWLSTPDECWGGPLEGLRQILSEGRLVGSAHAIRDQRPVVCFSLLPLAAIDHRREYRRGRQHWDYEPFGIALRLSVAIQLGARPVIYGNEADWAALPEDDRPWFQPRRSRPGRGRPPNSWWGEHEWRVLGNIELDRLPHDQWCSFVPSVAAARDLASTTNAKILVLRDL